ncbi:MAG: ribonuclease HI [Spirochaetae bacterium HGW-Spirochaetae-1]|nr:MAG: ribonuclease HI [Spirochaetae bacterium HGW-Spirochaetae-1]
MTKIRMFTDGACSGNPGPGGWACIVQFEDSTELVLSGGNILTTNNKMELQAVIEGMKKLKTGDAVVITTDSEYVKNGITSWIYGWIKNGWKTAAKKPVKNQELWMELWSFTRGLDITWEWVRGHSGHPENERCDRIARNEISKLTGK